jgi:hypothetical protein
MSKVEVNQISSQCGSTLTIGQSGDTVTLACGATQTGFGRTGTVDWDTTAKTASFTAVSGNGYFVNTTSGAITVTLPAGSAGSIVSLKDYANTWDTNNVTVTPNGTDKINGVNENANLNTEDQSVTLVYVDSTKGWRAVQDSTSSVTGAAYITATGGTITTCGDYKIHTFTSPDTFCVSALGSPVNNTVDYLVAAGGGGGGQHPGADNGAGGGGGGYRESSGAASGCYTRSPLGACVSALPVTVQGYPITVGAGGSKGTCGPTTGHGGQGSNSIFSTITSTGGGGGGGFAPACGTFPPSGRAGGPGGSGGGAGGGAALNNPGGSGNTPPVSPPQGQNGGNSASSPPDQAGGGGGGATEAGVQGSGSPAGGGRGGAGATSSINGTPTGRAGGGGTSNGGASPCGSGTAGAVGTDASNAAANSAGGAGGIRCGAGGYTGGAGGSGIVIIRYKYQ